MSAVLTEAATYAATVTVPTDGDIRNAASVLSAFQTLADRAKYLKTNGPAASAASSRQVMLGLGWDSNVTPKWIHYLGALAQTATSVQSVDFDLDLPVGVVVTSVVVSVYGNGGSLGHAGAPGTLPSLQFARREVSTQTDTVISTQADVYVSQAAYDSVHTITVSPAHTVLIGNRYQARITGEAGANFLAGYTVLGLVVSWTAI